jgi:hypothetical protein
MEGTNHSQRGPESVGIWPRALQARRAGPTDSMDANRPTAAGQPEPRMRVGRKGAAEDTRKAPCSSRKAAWRRQCAVRERKARAPVMQ